MRYLIGSSVIIRTLKVKVKGSGVRGFTVQGVKDCTGVPGTVS